jgi:hypothetical protein
LDLRLPPVVGENAHRMGTEKQQQAENHHGHERSILLGSVICGMASKQRQLNRCDIGSLGAHAASLSTSHARHRMMGIPDP